MRFGIGGLALAVLLSTTACSKTDAPPAAAATAVVSPLTEGAHGVLGPQTAKIKVKGAKGDYAADVAMTPNWWVGGGEFKVVWYAGLSQTKRFFTFSNETGDAKDKPEFLKNPETGVRQVEVSFDGGAPMTLKPTTARAPFKIPPGAKAVTQIKVDYGPDDHPESLIWK